MVKILAKPSCGNCVFWHAEQSTKHEFDAHECRLRPPTVLESRIEPRAFFAEFPKTFAETWCGDWRARDTARKKPVKANRRAR